MEPLKKCHRCGDTTAGTTTIIVDRKIGNFNYRKTVSVPLCTSCFLNHGYQVIQDSRSEYYNYLEDKAG